MAEYRWICVRKDEVGLFTADLKDGNTVVENLGGSYPKVNSVILDARNKWGSLPIHGSAFDPTSNSS
jgi:hypothetical protein